MDVYNPMERSDPPPVLVASQEPEAENLAQERIIARQEEDADRNSVEERERGAQRRGEPVLGEEVVFHCDFEPPSDCCVPSGVIT